MPTIIRSRSIKTTAHAGLDTTPMLVVVAVSLMLALAFCAAFAPRPMVDATVAAMQGGL